MKEFILAFLSRAYNMDTDSIAELLFQKNSDDGQLTDTLQDDALNALIRLDQERAGKLKGDGKTQFDNGFKKAQKDVSEKWERLLREKFELDATATGEQLLDALAEKMTAGTDLPDEQIRRSKIYRDLEKAAAERERIATEQAEAKVQEILSAQGRKEKLSVVREKAKTWLLGKKPVLEANQTVADQRINDFLRELEQYDYDDDLTPLKDGEILKNEHQHPIQFDKLMETVASRRFEFMTQDPKGNGGNKNQPPGPSGALPPIPKTREEFEKAYYDIPATDPAARTAFAKAYEDSQRQA